MFKVQKQGGKCTGRAEQLRMEHKMAGGRAGSAAQPVLMGGHAYLRMAATAMAATAPRMLRPAPTPTSPSLIISLSQASSSASAWRNSG